ncbi:MAG TPA: fumarylacetoacetate hydrolase family protein [Acidimicrobiales bacterium]|nr:fumarylacetoacetate hydrolase family protein [Acidimicrobiales bacterium]
MKLLRIGRPGAERPAAQPDDGRVVDLGDEVTDFDGAFFATGGLDRVRRLLAEAPDELPTVDLAGKRVGPPIAPPSKIVAIGLNYADHVAEQGARMPSEPEVFFKAPNTLVGPTDDVLRPVGSTKLDYEVELAVVIGRPARYLPDEDAARSAIAGLAVANDVSERAFQLERGRQWTKGKSCETFNPLGPWLVTLDEVDDPQNLGMWLTVNGEVRQQSNTKEMIAGVFELVRYLSQFMVLEPGDLVDTGTPGGVALAMDPPRYLQVGDVVELGIDGLGQQRLRIVPATV